MRLCQFDVTHLSTVDNGKASKNSLFISRHALESGSSVMGCQTVASAMRLVNLRAKSVLKKGTGTSVTLEFCEKDRVQLGASPLFQRPAKQSPPIRAPTGFLEAPL